MFSFKSIELLGRCYNYYLQKYSSLGGAVLKGHNHAIPVNFKNQKHVLTSMNTHK